MTIGLELERLDRRERIAIVLYFMIGLEDPDIAAVFGVSRQRAWQLRSRGLRKLRARFGGR